MSELMTYAATAKPTGARETLSASGLFSALPDAFLTELAARSSPRTVRRGERLWSYGAPSAALGIVASGRVKCWSAGRDSRQWVSSVVRPGGVCGLAAC